MRAWLGLLLQSALCVQANVAFVASPPRWQGNIVEVPNQHFPSSAVTFSAASQTEQSLSGYSVASTMLLVGACVGILARARRMRKDATGVARSVWTFYPLEAKECPELGTLSYGPAWKSSVMLKRQAKNTMGRKTRYMRQQQKLRDEKVWWGTYGAWTKWYPNRERFNLYTGPESHPDNPDFPAASSGLRALQGWAASPVAASAPAGHGTGAFVAGRTPTLRSAKRSVQAVRPARSGIVLKAHKKAASSTRNQGHTLRPHFWGVKALNGKAVKCGQLLVKQKGLNWYPGANVLQAKNDSLIALKDGIVQWRGSYKHKEVIVVPWEYVRTKCVWKNCNTLSPKEYEPWMGNDFNRRGKRHHIGRLYKTWKETEEGQAHLNKKAAKIEKQKEIQAKIRAHTKLKKKGVRGEPKEKVTAGDSESEAEN